MEPEPPKLDYQRPLPPPLPQERPGMNWRAFSLGLFGGLGISALYYILMGLGIIPLESPTWALGAVILKLALAIALLFVDGWKAVGLGLIASIPLAVLIFIGVCFGAFTLG